VNSDERKYWLDEPNNVKKVIYALCIVCVGLFLADALYHSIRILKQKISSDFMQSSDL
jgi:hypothetical protein